MVNEQVMGREVREGLGQRANSLPPQARFLEGSVQEKGRTGGDTVFRGLSGATLPTKKIFTCIRHAGGQVHRAARWVPGRCWGRQPLDSNASVRSQHFCKSVLLSFCLQAGGLGKQVRGGICRRDRDGLAPHPQCPGLGQVTLPTSGGPSLSSPGHCPQICQA